LIYYIDFSNYIVNAQYNTIDIQISTKYVHIFSFNEIIGIQSINKFQQLTSICNNYRFGKISKYKCVLFMERR